MTVNQPDGSIEDQAAHWVARMDGAWNAEEEAALQAWLSQDLRRHGALLDAQASWATLDRAESEQSELSPIASKGVSRRAMFAGLGTAIAATIVAGVVLRPQPVIYETKVGEVRRVPLDDGSIAFINTESAVEIAYSRERRDIALRRGEAWFHVAKNAQRPFVVEAGPARVRAVGTAFSTHRLEDRTEILVTEGVTEVWSERAGGRYRIVAGERAIVFDNGSVVKEKGASSSIERDLAWREGRIELAGLSLAAAIAGFNRYSRRRIILLDPSLAGEQFDGNFRIDDIEGFATAVRAGLGVPVTMSSSEIRIGSPNALSH